MAVDVVFSFDTTGSMYPCLSEVRRKAVDTVNALFETVEDLRVGIIAHGDYCDWRSSYVTKHHQLTSDRSSLVRFIETVPPTGGGDSDEAYELVLFEAREKMQWRTEANRILVVIGDASPHNPGYRRQDTNMKLELDWLTETRNLVNAGVSIYPVQCLNRRENNAFYANVAKISSTPHLNLYQFSDIVQLIMAVTFKQQDNTLVERLGDELQGSNKLTRSLATVLNQLLGEDRYEGAYTAEITPVDYSSREYSAGRSYRSTYGTKLADELTEVDPSRFQVLHVDHNTAINDFVRSTGAVFRTGKGFYELTKAETIQESKEVVLVKPDGTMLSGKPARDMIGVPFGTRGTARPNPKLEYTVFVQSTSANRKLIGGTKFLYEAK